MEETKTKMIDANKKEMLKRLLMAKMKAKAAESDSSDSDSSESDSDEDSDDDLVLGIEA